MGKGDSADITALETDSESISPQIDNKVPNYVSLEANTNRRSGKERRNFKYTAYIPERRSGIDRRGIGWYRN